MLALPVDSMNKLCLPVHSVERAKALESPSSVWERNLGLSLPRLRILGHITIWAPLPSCKTANTTYLPDEETENLQFTTKLRLMVKGRKLKWIGSKKGQVRYQEKIRRKTQQRGYGKWRVKTNASLAYLDSEQTLLESSFWFQCCFGVQEMWSGRVRIGPLPEACAMIKTTLPKTLNL